MANDDDFETSMLEDGDNDGASLDESPDAAFDVARFCDYCSRETASDEGICYECQTIYHASGAFDMDGEGWR